MKRPIERKGCTAYDNPIMVLARIEVNMSVFKRAWNHANQKWIRLRNVWYYYQVLKVSHCIFIWMSLPLKSSCPLHSCNTYLQFLYFSLSPPLSLSVFSLCVCCPSKKEWIVIFHLAYCITFVGICIHKKETFECTFVCACHYTLRHSQNRILILGWERESESRKCCFVYY